MRKSFAGGRFPTPPLRFALICVFCSPKIGWTQPVRKACPMPRGAAEDAGVRADKAVGPRLDVKAILLSIGRVWGVTDRGVRCVGSLRRIADEVCHRVAATEVWPGFQDQRFDARPSQPERRMPSGDPGADDYHVSVKFVTFGQIESSQGSRWIRPPAKSRSANARRLGKRQNLPCQRLMKP